MISVHELCAIIKTPWILKKFGSYSDGRPTCMSLVRWAYFKNGICLSHDYIPFIEEFLPIHEGSSLQFLDLICMTRHKPFVDHLGLYLEEGKLIHVQQSGTVIIQKLTDVEHTTVAVLRYKDFPTRT